jgi:hypothetical protein
MARAGSTHAAVTPAATTKMRAYHPSEGTVLGYPLATRSA